MDPNANLASQAELLNSTSPYAKARLRELREALREWLNLEGFHPSWSRYQAATDAFHEWDRAPRASLQRVRMSGAYETGSGQYFGLGAPVYRLEVLWNNHPNEYVCEEFRAGSRERAIEKARIIIANSNVRARVW